ncbi:MAG: fatty acyl-AMP ligase, partial [Acidobacteriota bacterium]
MHDVSTWIDLLRQRAADAPARPVYTFLADGETESATLTHADLDRHARRIAGQLAQAGAQPGDRALLLYPPGLDFIVGFWGCLYAGVIAVPAYPPRRQGKNGTLAAIADDCRPAAVLSDAAMAPRARALDAEAPALVDVPRVRTDLADADDAPNDAGARWIRPAIGGDSLAFLQYTSGSTSLPRGVRVAHRHLLHNAEAIRRGFSQDADKVVVSWLPLYHDMGLIGNVLQPLYTGARTVLMASASFLQKPARWLRAISRYRANASGGPNFAYALCAERIDEATKATLDLSSWQVAFNGAEPVRADTLERFADAFAACGFQRAAFRPCYGLAEGTLLVTTGTIGTPPPVVRVDADALADDRVAPIADAGSDADRDASARSRRDLVGCGRAWHEQIVRIVDPVTCRPCSADGVGEIWVAGGSVAGGYWNRPDDSEALFRARLADDPDAGPFLRTGDLGFLHDGELYVTGRRKDLLIVRGRN